MNADKKNNVENIVSLIKKLSLEEGLKLNVLLKKELGLPEDFNFGLAGNTASSNKEVISQEKTAKKEVILDVKIQ